MNHQNMIITEDKTVVQAMQILDNAPKKVLFIVEGTKLIASVSDGDIRRWIISNGNINDSVYAAANHSPKFLLKNEIGLASDYFEKYGFQAIPVVDSEKNIIEIILKDFSGKDEDANKFNLPVVMMAGGFGTRLYPYTKILPKPLIPIGDIPIAEHIINGFYKYGCDRFFLVVNHKKNMIKAYFNEIERGYSVEYADEDEPLGTGGGLSLLKGKIDKTFIFTNCDILITDDFYNIYQYHKQEKNIITMVCSLKNIKIPYGVVEIGKDGSIESMKEKPEFSFFTNTGCYIVEPEVIDHIKENTYIGFPDVVEEYRNSGKRVGVYPISENSWLDMGQLDELENMKKKLNVD